MGNQATSPPTSARRVSPRREVERMGIIVAIAAAALVVLLGQLTSVEAGEAAVSTPSLYSPNTSVGLFDRQQPFCPKPPSTLLQHLFGEASFSKDSSCRASGVFRENRSRGEKALGSSEREPSGTGSTKFWDFTSFTDRGNAEGEQIEISSNSSSSSSSSTKGNISTCNSTDEEDVYDNFIVTFEGYKPLHEHKALFEKEMLSSRFSQAEEEGGGGGEKGRSWWKWIDRDNVAVKKFPTDFGLVGLQRRHAKDVLATLQGLNLVKGVFADKTIKRSLKSSSSFQKRYNPFEERDHDQDHNHRLEEKEEELEQSEKSEKTVDTEAIDYFGGQLEAGDVLVKGPGRLHTPFSFDSDSDPDAGADSSSFNATARRQLSFKLFHRGQINKLYTPEPLWQDGYTGQGIRVGIFDTGVREDHPDLRNIVLRTNWTFQQTLSDGLGHGSFVAGCIGSVNPSCPSVAPDADIYTFKVFTDAQESFTSWYLDAMNYAMMIKVHIINVSIGGPDYSDRPFVDKFREAAANGIILFIAMGNDGPNWGTPNNPGDEVWSIGVGGHTSNGDISHFQARGMTIQEAPYGYGRIKPDIVAYGSEVSSLRIERGCREMSGTSVASPVAAGLGTLLASTVPQKERFKKLTPASMKQVLIEGAEKVPHESAYVQGPGIANLLNSYNILKSYKPRVSIFPSSVDLTDLEYWWPHSKMPLYPDAMPMMLNLTIINGLGETGYFTKEPVWQPSNELGRELSFEFDHESVIWPWASYLGMRIRVKSSKRAKTGIAEGKVSFKIYSPPFPGEKNGREQEVTLPFKSIVIPTPDRSKRILWDDYHNIQYPPDFIPIDDLTYGREVLDWNGDHPHTNFHPVFNFLTENGYYVEVLGSSMTCFDASQYGTFVLIDTEGEFHEEEITKLHTDVTEKGMGLLVIGEWYNKRQMEQLKFFDDNTRSIWTPVVGGANVPALNRLLANFGIGFSAEKPTDITGKLFIGRNTVQIKGGTSIVTFPPNSTIFNLQNGYPILGLGRVGKGNVLAFGDTSAFDINLGSQLVPDLFLDFVKYTGESQYPNWLNGGKKHPEEFRSKKGSMPPIEEGLDFSTLQILKRPLACHRNLPLSSLEEPNGAGSAQQKEGTREEEPISVPIPANTENVSSTLEEQTTVPGHSFVVNPGEGNNELHERGGGGESQTPKVFDMSNYPPAARVDTTGNIFAGYFQRQLSLLFLVVVCLAILLLWRRVSSRKRNRVRAAKNRYNRLRQIV